MDSERSQERKLEERICCEEGCDRPTAHGDVRCELHVLRMGKALLRPPEAETLPIVSVPVLDAIAPMKAIALPEPEPRRAGLRLGVAATCQAIGLMSLAALLETLRYFDSGFLGRLPSLALLEVPYSAFLNIQLPMAAWILLTAVQLDQAWKAQRAARSPRGRRLGRALFVAGLAVATVTVLAAGNSFLWLILGKWGSQPPPIWPG